MTLTPRLPRVKRQCVALFSLREEVADVGHGGGEVGPPEATQQRQHEEDKIGGFRVLHGIADADGGQKQRCGRDCRPEASAENRHHEAIEDAQRCARQGRQGSEPEQLLWCEGKSDGRKSRDHHRPDHPDREGQKQRRDRDPEIAARDGAALISPELRILGAPILQHTRHGRAFRVVDRLHLGELRQPVEYFTVRRTLHRADRQVHPGQGNGDQNEQQGKA
jgi:hypothetical protein